MSLFITTIINNYNDFLEKSDKRTENYFLAGSPLPILIITLIYYLFVKKWGPSFMEYRKPYNLDRIIPIFNLFQMVANGYLVYVATLNMIRTEFNFHCQGLDWLTPNGMEQANICYIYYLVKISDLLDTVFFILRKKNKQATVLHVYHHFMMVIFSYYIVKHVAGGHVILVGCINAFVHVVMYFYYFLTSFKPELKQSLWWKKHITQLQMVQFGYLLIHSSLALTAGCCGLPKPYVYMSLLQTSLIFALFCNFYNRTYTSQKKNEK